MRHETTQIDCRAVFDGMAARWDSMHPVDEQEAAILRGVDLVGTIENQVVVDVGCGTGLLEGFILPRLGGGRIVAVDSSPGMMAQARNKHADHRIDWVCADVLETDLESSSVHAVLCYNTWPHFADHRATARELVRWLKPRGRLLVWHDIGRARLASIHSEVGGPLTGHRLPPVDVMASLFAGCGLQVLQADEGSDFYTLLAQRPDEVAE